MNTILIVTMGVMVAALIGYGDRRIVAIPAYAVLLWCAALSVLL